MDHRRPPLPSARRARGAALLTAMIIVSLVATLAGSMLWRQWRSVQIEAAERDRTQASWILMGALDWARLILREDARTGGADHLSEPWATPLAEARLSTFLAADQSNTEDAPEAFLSGQIIDAQSRFNLRSVVNQGQLSEPHLRALQKLCETLNIDSSVPGVIANGLRLALPAPVVDGTGGRQGGGTPTPSTDAPLLPATAEQLRWLGLDAQTVERLAPYVVLLPQATPVNVNTAPREVLVAVLEGVDPGSAERLVQVRQRTPFTSIEGLRQHVGPTVPLDASRLDVRSEFFEVRGRLRLGTRVIEERSLVQRRGLQVTVLRRERSTMTVQ
ncbi:MAG TPA: type II secretion system minor pseudopilin GspK [Burkholderiaceae bacterium]|nr:type II secretion system minor pseudopilin GspK [Burkholderiaceae bacterium]